MLYSLQKKDDYDKENFTSLNLPCDNSLTMR
jgi:hypothetical protein